MLHLLHKFFYTVKHLIHPKSSYVWIILLYNFEMAFAPFCIGSLLADVIFSGNSAISDWHVYGRTRSLGSCAIMYPVDKLHRQSLEHNST